MMYYLLMPVFVLILMAFQSTFLELLFFGTIGVEISLLVVIYAGFRLDIVRGGSLAFIFGFFMDAMTSVIPGIYVIIYMMVFFVSELISDKVYAESFSFVMGYSLLCSLFEGVVIVSACRIFYGIDVVNSMLTLYVPQSIILALLSPFVFWACKRVEESLNEATPQSLNRL